MDLLGSECSSGCESGWTLYLEHSFLSHGGSDRIVGRDGGLCDGYWKSKCSEEDEEVEDLSMVSDASSGPPHFIEDDACSHEDDGHFSHASKPATLGKRKGKKQKIKEYQCHQPSSSSFLDDTASSPALNFTPNSFANQASMESFMEFSQTSHFEERAAFTDHFGFLQSSLSGNRLQKNQWFEEKGMGMR